MRPVTSNTVSRTTKNFSSSSYIILNHQDGTSSRRVKIPRIVTNSAACISYLTTRSQPTIVRLTARWTFWVTLVAFMMRSGTCSRPCWSLSLHFNVSRQSWSPYSARRNRLRLRMKITFICNFAERDQNVSGRGRWKQTSSLSRQSRITGTTHAEIAENRRKCRPITSVRWTRSWTCKGLLRGSAHLWAPYYASYRTVNYFSSTSWASWYWKTTWSSQMTQILTSMFLSVVKWSLIRGLSMTWSKVAASMTSACSSFTVWLGQSKAQKSNYLNELWLTRVTGSMSYLSSIRQRCRWDLSKTWTTKSI